MSDVPQNLPQVTPYTYGTRHFALIKTHHTPVGALFFSSLLNYHDGRYQGFTVSLRNEYWSNSGYAGTQTSFSFW